MNEVKSTRELVADKVYWIQRLAILAAIVLIFFPAFNPARVCLMVNDNLSLFTSAVSYSGLRQDVATHLRFGVVEEGTYRCLQYGSIIACVSIVLLIVAGCMSLGNKKFKKTGNIFAVVGASGVLGGLYFIYDTYCKIVEQIKAYEAAKGPGKWEAILPSIPNGMYIYIGLALAIIVTTVIVSLLLPATGKEEKYHMETKFKLFLAMLPFIALVFVFSYLPLFGWRYAFFDYQSGIDLTADNFVGFKWFKFLFQDPQTRKDVFNVLRNTLIMSGLGLATSWIPMAFAIFLNEIKCKWFRRGVQVLTTIPNFVSWVMVYAIAFAMFSSEGMINELLGTSEDMLLHSEGTWFKMLAWGVWKGTGWSAIIYVAGISGIDQQLYEAATVDGAGRFQRMIHITVPGLLPTFFVLLLMSIANILTNGMDQYLVFENKVNKEVITVLDLYVYKLGLGEGSSIPLSTVVSMFKSVVSVILLFSANGVSKLIRGESIM